MNTIGALARKRIFVTGATGMVGSHLVRQLVGAGAEVTALIRDYIPNSYLFAPLDSLGDGRHGGRPSRSQVGGHGGPPSVAAGDSGGPGSVPAASAICRLPFNVVAGELEDGPLLERALAEHEIEVVFHLGAQTIVTTANASPVGTFRANIEGTWNLLEACRRLPRVKAVVIASSDKAYGQADALPYTEDTPLRGEHPYDVSKSCADLIARAYWVTYRTPVVITRCGNIFGPGDLNFSRIIPGTIRSALRNERPVIRSDGRMIRDYFYVKDAAAAYMRSAEALLAEPERMGGEAFNFSTDEPMDVLTVTHRVLSVMGRTDLEPVILNEARAEILAQSLSSAKARRMLGWAPAYDFDAGVEETVEFVKKVLGA